MGGVYIAIPVVASGSLATISAFLFWDGEVTTVGLPASVGRGRCEGMARGSLHHLKRWCVGF